jgi:CubicO group peptidase (beta-lactamase class C family)
MKNIQLIKFILIFVCGALSAQSNFRTVKPEKAGFSTERLARIDTVINQYIQQGKVPNMVTFIARHGKVVHHKAYGWKNIENKEPVQLNSIYRNASQTKALTSVGLMKLYEKGLFLLDDPISKYIPEFKNPHVLVSINEKDSSFSSRPAKTEITIRHLLSHTSGIPYGNKVFTKARIPGVNSLEPITIGEVVHKIAKLPLDHDPGEKFTYGLNTDVLGYLIEVLSGMPLDKYFQQELFEPLGMVDSYFYLPKDKENRLVTLYAQDSINSPLYRSPNIANQTYPYSGSKTYFSGGAGIVGTIDDYARFCTMLLNKGKLNGKQFLSPKTIELMTRNQIGENEVWQSGNKFGLGFELFTDKGLAKLPGSIGAFKWGGMYCTDYIIDPKEDLILLIYTNASPFASGDINSKFRVLVYQALLK